MPIERHDLGIIARKSVPDAIRHTFNQPDGSPRDLSNHTIEVWLKKAGTDGNVVGPRTAVKVDAPNGELEYTFQEGDMDTEGSGDEALKVQFVAYIDDGGTITERHISDIARIDVGPTFASSEYDA